MLTGAFCRSSLWRRDGGDDDRLGFGRHPCWMAWCEHRAVGGGGPQHPELIFGWEAIMRTLIRLVIAVFVLLVVTVMLAG